MSLGAMTCSMHVLPGHRAFKVGDGSEGSRATAYGCRRQRLIASSAEECAAACLVQPFCEASTWFDSTHPVSTLRRLCLGRTAGTPAILTVDPAASAAVRVCEVPTCGLQQQLDLVCQRFAQSSRTPQVCRGSSVARNLRMLGQHDSSLEDYDWGCVPPPAPNASFQLACTDDRGEMIACLAPRESRDHRDARFCEIGRASCRERV